MDNSVVAFDKLEIIQGSARQCREFVRMHVATSMHVCGAEKRWQSYHSLTGPSWVDDVMDVINA